MTLNELINVQKRFDGNHKGKFCWDEKISDDNLEILEFLEKNKERFRNYELQDK